MLLIEVFAVFLFPAALVAWSAAFFPESFADQPKLENAGDWILSLAGPLLMARVLVDIFRPRVKIEGCIRIGSFEFCSTHPSYVLIDSRALAFAGSLFLIDRSLETPSKVI